MQVQKAADAQYIFVHMLYIKERKNIYFLNHSALVVTQFITIGKNN
jgi:hypothetical protein